MGNQYGGLLTVKYMQLEQTFVGQNKEDRSLWLVVLLIHLPYTIIDFWWGLLMTMKTASGIGWPTP